MRWPDLPPLNSLLPFEATVRHASMTRAAQELHVTHGAVSRQIQSLEKALGTTLFERGTRSLRPTAQAGRLAAAVRDALDQVDAAAREVSRRERGGPLALSCEPTLLMRWLIPRLPDLATQAPGLTVHLSAGGGPVSFERDPIDVALRRDDFPVPETVSRAPLFTERIGPVCSPELAARITARASRSRAECFAGLTILHTSTRPSAWDDWQRITRTRAEGAGEQTFEHFYLALQAAVAGVGVAIGPHALVHDDLLSGQLVAPFGLVADGTGYHLLSPRPPEQDSRIALLLGWLRSQAGEL
ncbi:MULTISPECIES: LysR substrate-binding domain-containing protein [Streptomyces]|uniref:LysR substrate-binding domain-containing protein n=1 Tax=Streptomyces TaxID=1883 RepID=UPI00131873BD|nr:MULTISPECIES: LysR substrate-binding domain-containing protein [Streptomyces]QGZ51372.1 LysR family transcriptional regulator [Streptomyces sp. QHH-9511]GGU06285.1 LysR family transcriptional regulator [Streptomyces lateritius]